MELIKRHFVVLDGRNSVSKKSAAKLDSVKNDCKSRCVDLILDYWVLLYGALELAILLKNDFVFEEVRSFCFRFSF
jgi:hypothetical protein